MPFSAKYKKHFCVSIFANSSVANVRDKAALGFGWLIGKREQGRETERERGEGEKKREQKSVMQEARAA